MDPNLISTRLTGICLTSSISTEAPLEIFQSLKELKAWLLITRCTSHMQHCWLHLTRAGTSLHSSEAEDEDIHNQTEVDSLNRAEVVSLSRTEVVSRKLDVPSVKHVTTQIAEKILT